MERSWAEQVRIHRCLFLISEIYISHAVWQLTILPLSQCTSWYFVFTEEWEEINESFWNCNFGSSHLCRDIILLSHANENSHFIGLNVTVQKVKTPRSQLNGTSVYHQHKCIVWLLSVYVYVWLILQLVSPCACKLLGKGQQALVQHHSFAAEPHRETWWPEGSHNWTHTLYHLSVLWLVTEYIKATLWRNCHFLCDLAGHREHTMFWMEHCCLNTNPRSL